MLNDERKSWERWRAVLDRITSHPDYRYDAPWERKQLLLKLANFACSMMAKHNTTYWIKK